MRQRPFRGLREVNVWQRGMDYVRAAYRAKSGRPRIKGTFKCPPRPSGKPSPSAAPGQANLSVLGAVSPGQYSQPVRPPGDTKASAKGRPVKSLSAKSSRCGPSSEVRLSIASRLASAARNQRARGLRFASRASLGPAARRDLRAWQRGGDFVQAANRPAGGLRQLWLKLLGRKRERGMMSLPRGAVGQGPEAMRIYLRNAARRRTQTAAVQPPARRNSPDAWNSVRQELQAAAATETRSKSFRDARWRQLAFGLLSKIFRRSQDNAVQSPYRPPVGWQPPPSKNKEQQ